MKGARPYRALKLADWHPFDVANMGFVGELSIR